MKKRMKEYFRREFFNERMPLKYHVFSIIFFETLLLSVVSATTNTILQKGVGGIIFQWSFVLFCVVLLFSSSARRMAVSKAMIIITGFIYIPFMYFQTAGYDGTSLLFALLFGFILSVFFSGKMRLFLIVSNLAEYLCCIALQYRIPALVVPHGAIEAKIIDTVVALVLTLGGMAIMTTYVNNAYEKELVRSKELIGEIQAANEKLEFLTNRDPLTGVFNRRYVDAYLHDALGECAENGSTMSVMMFDLDFFKRINDTYGHSFGDYVLKQVAETVDNKLRASDVFARYGGEEFIAVLQGDTVDAAAMIAERLREAVRDIPLRHNVQITISIGIAHLQPGDEMQSLVDRADKMLYQAKEQGRDRVCC